MESTEIPIPKQIKGIPTLIFATGNAHKVEEVQALLKGLFHILSLKDIGFDEDIVEDADTFEGNALIKAQFIQNKYQVDCFAEDSGIVVEALNGAPGIHSARYAGTRSDIDNIFKLLQNMEGKENRAAKFVSSIALVKNEEKYFFYGEVKGNLTKKAQGLAGFGYDPIFVPEGYQDTFGILPQTIKNKISHRKKSVEQLIDFLTPKK